MGGPTSPGVAPHTRVPTHTPTHPPTHAHAQDNATYAANRVPGDVANATAGTRFPSYYNGAVPTDCIVRMQGRWVLYGVVVCAEGGVVWCCEWCRGGCGWGDSTCAMCLMHLLLLHACPCPPPPPAATYTCHPSDSKCNSNLQAAQLLCQVRAGQGRVCRGRGAGGGESAKVVPSDPPAALPQPGGGPLLLPSDSRGASDADVRAVA